MNENMNIKSDYNNNYVFILYYFYLVVLINRTLYITNIADSFTDCFRYGYGLLSLVVMDKSIC